MLSQEIIVVPANAINTKSLKLDFQDGNIVVSIIPVLTDESAQVAKAFAASLQWSSNNKYSVTEPICDLTEASSGESLVTIIQAPYLTVSIRNYELTDQSFYISVYAPGTPSRGGI